MVEKASQFSKEFRAILLALGLQLDEEVDNGLSTLLLSKGFDWDQLSRLLLRHRVWVPFCSALKMRKVWESLSRHNRSTLESQAHLQQLQQLSLVGELVKIGAALREAQIEFLCLKGPVLSQLLYGDPTKRHSSDLDILVQPEDIHRSLRTLGKLGYKLSSLKDLESRGMGDPVWGNLHHVRLHRKGFCLELHWRLSRNDRLYKLSFRELYARKHAVSLGGQGLSTLGKEDMVEYLALHGASHCWNRLKWVLDGKLLRETPSCFPLSPPGSQPVDLMFSIVAAVLETDVALAYKRANWRSKVCLKQLTAEDENPGSLLQMVRRTILVSSLYSGIVQRLRYLASLLVWPAAYELIRLPRSISFLYSVIGPVLWGREQLRMLLAKARG